MNVTVQDLAPCKKLVRIEVEAERVDKTFEEVTRDYQRHSSFPGFRPGKAPIPMVVRKYNKEIEDEVRRKLTQDAYKEAVDQQKLDTVNSPDIEQIQFGRSQPMHFAATVETAPQFDMPEYKGIPVKRETTSVTEEDVVKALDALRATQVTFNKVERPVQTGDIAVVNYTGTCDGKPILELAPTAKGLTEQKNFWVETGTQSFIPGFADQLMGAQAGDKRTVTVSFPADFVTPQLAGKQGVYAVEVAEVKEKVLPPLDDAFAKNYGAENLEKLREGVRKDLDNELTFKKNRSVRQQILRSLLNRVNFELPESSVARETKNVVYEIVQENAKRGIARDAIEKEKDAIYSAASQGARERVKLQFLMQKIAEKEDVKVSQDEIAQRVSRLAATYQIPAEKLAENIQQRNAWIEIYDQVMTDKVMDLLQGQAKVEEVPPGTPV